MGLGGKAGINRMAQAIAALFTTRPLGIFRTLPKTILGTIVLVSLALGLGGCGGADLPWEQASSPQEVTVTLDPVAQVRQVYHALGETDVPLHPQRVVALGNLPLESALVLGLTPVGAAPDSFAGNPGQFPSYWPAEALEGVAYVGDEEQPNLERLVNLQPDLILGLYPVHGGIYGQLSQIAPTVLYPVFDGKSFVPWQQALGDYGRILGREDEATATIAAYDDRIAQWQATAPPGWQGSPGERREVSVVRFMPGQLRVYLAGSFAGRVLQDLGLSRPPSQSALGFFDRISLERLDEADGDVMFLLQSDPKAVLYGELSQTPLWQSLRAVQGGQVFPVDYDYWLSEGPIAADRLLDDVFTALSGPGLPPDRD